MKNTYGPHYTVKDGVLFIHGSDHWLEWLHHIAPFSKRRELKWALQILDEINIDEISIIAGHSIGGTKAIMVAELSLGYYLGAIKLYTYGAKRPPRPFRGDKGTHYRVKGDIVPFLPPWRRMLNTIVLDRGKLGFMEAHEPREYGIRMSMDGVRGK